MAIINLTDEKSLRSAFPRLGKLRKGGPQKEITKNGKKVKVVGDELDYFRFTSDREEIVQAFNEAFGPDPRMLQIYIPHKTPSEAFATWCEIWDVSGLVHRCDGKTMSVWREGDGYTRGEKACTGGHTKNDYLNDAVGRLEMIIPELIEAGHVGYVTLETHSKHDLIGILSVLNKVFEVSGDLSGIMWTLRRVPEVIGVPGFGDRKGQRSRAEKYLVKLEPAKTWVEMQIEMARRGRMVALPSGDEADVVDSEFVDHSFEDAGHEIVDEGRYDENPAPPQPSTPPPTNGSEDVAGKIAKLGQELYPEGKWGEVKGSVWEAYKKDLSAVYKFLEDRKQNILGNRETWTAHVAKNWPGMEVLLPQVSLALHSDVYDRMLALKGIAIAAKKPKGTTDQVLVGIILAAIPETDIPEEFR